MRIAFSRTERRISALAFVVSLVLAAYAQSYPIAGINPDQRPAGAPEVTKVEKGKQWYPRALTGVKTPYPASLRFLEDQGNWFTPFTQPGMPGRYDLRRWYRQADEKKRGS